MIYADFNGSAPLCNDVKEYLINRIQNGSFSNPNAVHPLGKKLMFEIEKSRRALSKFLGCNSKQIIFNSGASEGISQIFSSILGDCPSGDKNIILTSGIEHSAIIQCCQLYTAKGYTVVTIKTNPEGRVDLDHLQELISNNRDKIAFITAMSANNETGIIQPYQEIGSLAQDNDILFFSDTTQFIGKTDFNFEESNMDFAVLSSHKIGALIGSGLIIAKDPSHLKPLILGGGQESGLRGGTQNYIGIETMSVAMKSFEKNKNLLPEISKYRDNFEKNIQKQYPQAVIIGESSPRLSTTTLIALPGLSGQSVQYELEAQDIFVTTSSACSDKKLETSAVLKAMDIKDNVGLSVVRISLCCNANEALYQKIEKALLCTYDKLVKCNSEFEQEENEKKSGKSKDPISEP